MSHLPTLIISATEAESVPLRAVLDNCQVVSPYLFSGAFSGRPVDILIGGIGSVTTTFRLTQLLLQRSYQNAISIGIAGAFVDDISIGEVVQITEDCFADLGIDDNGTFRDLSEIGLAIVDEYPFEHGRVINPLPVPAKYLSVIGVTVQTASGSEPRISQLISRYHPQVETMENAAFFYVCRMMKLPFASFRAISNKVEPRNRNNWRVPQAIERVNMAICELL